MAGDGVLKYFRNSEASKVTTSVVTVNYIEVLTLEKFQRYVLSDLCPIRS